MASVVSKYLKGLEARLAALEGKLGVAAPAAAGAGDEEEEEEAPEWLTAYDELLAGPLAKFVATSGSLPGPVAELGAGLKGVFEAVRGILALVPKSKKPSPTELFASPAGKALQAAMKSVSSVNPGEFNNHAKSVNEALPACNWIAVDTMPHSLVEGQRDAADFWLNKVRVAFKDKEGDHRGWAAQLKDLLTGLYTYVKAHHKAGITWNGRGTPIGESAAAPAPAAATPPPAAAAAPSEDGAVKSAAAMAGLAAQLGALDQSSGRTAGLRRVTADMKAKNMKDKPALKPKKAGGAAAGKKKAAGAKKAAAPKPPRLQLVGKRWFCEHQTGMVEVDIAHASQEVYVYGCDGATVQINGKCTALQVDKCSKTNVLFDKVIAAVSVVDCKRLKIQARVECKSFTLDKTDGATVYLNWASRDAQITTSKCSELNVSFPVAEEEDAEWTEQAIPEQFVTTIAADGSVSTHVSELYTHG